MAVFSSNVILFHLPNHTKFPLALGSSFHLPSVRTAKQMKNVYLKAVPQFTLATTTSWAQFSDNVSGEWDGFGADFTAEGEPIQLPESVVPEAYREWDVKVFDWQTQCPTLAQFHHHNDDHHSLSFMYKNIELLPTVGCEADAATTHTIQERHITTTTTPTTPTTTITPPFAYQPTGCYVALWPDQLSTSTNTMELEHCLVDPRNRESRVRVIQVLESSLKLRSIRVFVEQWYGPFRNGDQLGGCAIRNSAFAATQPLKASQVSGVWQSLNVAAKFSNCHDHTMRPLGIRDGFAQRSIRDRDGVDLILLPNQLWCSLKRAQDMETCCEVGWLLSPGHAITSTCTFSSTAQIKEITVATETAVPVL